MTACPAFPRVWGLLRSRAPYSGPGAHGITQGRGLGLVLEWRSGRLLTLGTAEDRLGPDDLCRDGPGSWVLAWATVYTPGPGVGHSAHPRWSVTPAQGPGEFRTLELLPGLLHHPRPRSSKLECGVHLVGSARAGPCSLAAAGWGVRARVPWVCVGISSCLWENCFTPPSVLLRWSRVTEGSSVVFREPLDFPAWLGLMSLVHRGLLFRFFQHSHVNCDSFGRSLRLCDKRWVSVLSVILGG